MNRDGILMRTQVSVLRGFYLLAAAAAAFLYWACSGGAKLGEPCDGVTTTCETPLECVFPAGAAAGACGVAQSDLNVSADAGTPEPVKVADGQACGTINGQPVACQDGFQCMNSDGDSDNLTGICVPVNPPIKVAEGQACGTINGQPIACQDGLKCMDEDGDADALTGICKLANQPATLGLSCAVRDCISTLTCQLLPGAAQPLCVQMRKAGEPCGGSFELCDEQSTCVQKEGTRTARCVAIDGAGNIISGENEVCGTGFACDAEAAVPLDCVAVPNYPSKFCLPRCEEHTECEAHELCFRGKNETQGHCIGGDRPPPAVGAGEVCDALPCQDGLICLEINPSLPKVCAADCTASKTVCAQDEVCTATANQTDAAKVCLKGANLNEECTPPLSPCVTSLVCVVENEGDITGKCFLGCELFTPQCPAETVCEPTGKPGDGVCVPPGFGRLGRGERCDAVVTNKGCATGLVCAADSVASASYCRGKCRSTESNTGCIENEDCVPFIEPKPGLEHDGACIPRQPPVSP